VLIALAPSGDRRPLRHGRRAGRVLCFALMILTGRSLRGTPDTTLVFWQTAGALAAGARPRALRLGAAHRVDFALLGLLGVVAMAAHVCVNRALKLADAATVAPIQYTLLPWAILFGWLFFGDVPGTATMLAGAAIIIGSGLFIFYRERAAARRGAA
jgi:drug/metabolite transporter (DMT)-like permease